MKRGLATLTGMALWIAVCGAQTRSRAQTDGGGNAAGPSEPPATNATLADAHAGGDRADRAPEAAATNRLREITISSERIEFDYKELIAVFDENVRVDSPQFFLTADRVIVFLDGTNQVRQIMALGHVTLTNEQRVASCDKAVYTRQDGQVVMTGSATLRRAGDHVRGDRIVIWLDDERMEVSPGHFVISPETFNPRPEGANAHALPQL